MNKSEISKLIKTIYGAYTVNWTEEQIKKYIEVWHEQLSSIPAINAFECLKRHIREKPQAPRICNFWEYWRNTPAIDNAYEDQVKLESESKLRDEFNQGWKTYERLPEEYKKSMIKIVEKKAKSKLGAIAFNNITESEGLELGLKQQIAIATAKSNIDNSELLDTPQEFNFMKYWKKLREGH